MDKQTLETILAFMERVQLTGKETVAFNACVKGLVDELQKLEIEAKIDEEVSEEE